MQRAILETRLAVRRALGAAMRRGLQGSPTLAAFEPLAPGALVLVALSGGADSLALAAAAASEAPKLGLRAGAVIIDHGLQAETAEVAERTAATATAWGLAPVLVRRVTVGSGGLGPEAAARDARYAAFAATVAETAAAAVLTAHTRDDQAEQVLLALARGSGTRSIAGIPHARSLAESTALAEGAGHAVVLRPFLGEAPEITRTVTEQACRELGVAPWRDPHNRDAVYARVRVRRRVLPVLADELGAGAAAGLARSADLAREDADALDALAAELAERALAEVPEVESPLADVAVMHAGLHGAAAPGGRPAADRPAQDSLIMSAAVLAEAPAALRNRAVRLLAMRGFGAHLDRGHVLAVAALATGPRGRGPVFVPGIRVSRSGDRLIFDEQRGSPRDADPESAVQ